MAIQRRRAKNCPAGTRLSVFGQNGNATLTIFRQLCVYNANENDRETTSASLSNLVEREWVGRII